VECALKSEKYSREDQRTNLILDRKNIFTQAQTLGNC